MIDKVREFIDKYSLSNKTLIVGFSGGYDSMCLLNILSDLREEKSLKIVAAHYNHNWRGKEAESEQQHCKNYCLNKNIEFYTETAPNNIKKNETEARELRYEFYERAVKKYSADAVLTAHNWEDNAETVLYRIIKGTGVVGLKGILPQRGIYYRPLINISRSDIEKYCEIKNLKPNLDSSNIDIIHKRNLIRHEIFPLLEKINPEVKKSLNSLSRIACDEMDIVEEYIRNIEKIIYNNGQIKTEEYIKLSESVKQKIIYNLIYNSEIDYTYELINNLVIFIEETVKNNKPSKYSLSSDCWLYVDKNIIDIIYEHEKDEEIIRLNKCGEYKIGKYIFKIEECSDFVSTENEKSAIVDFSSFPIQDLIIRTRRYGDVIKPLGFNGTMKLKKYLMSKKIPVFMRDELILVTSVKNDKEILWVAGVGLSDTIKTTDKPTHKISIAKDE